MHKVKVNPEILIWARETAGLTRKEAAEKLFQSASTRTPEQRLANMESGKELPSRANLHAMATLYYRPPLVFYLSQKPQEETPPIDFRANPSSNTRRENALLNALIRNMRARQSILRAAMEEDEEVGAEPVEFLGSQSMPNGRGCVLDALKAVLNMDLSEYRKQRDDPEAFKLLRSHAESAGVFVLLAGNLGNYHTDLSADVFRGFCLFDEIAPFIVINPADARPAQSFTLLHELTHLLLGHSGISAGYHGHNQTELFCNDVAGEYLLPTEDLSALPISKDAPVQTFSERISEFALQCRLSASMVAYKAYRSDMISQSDLEFLLDLYRRKWHEQRERERERERARRKEKEKETDKKTGGPPPIRYLLGAALIQRVRELTQSGLLSSVKAGQILKTRPYNVHKLLDLQPLR